MSPQGLVLATGAASSSTAFLNNRLRAIFQPELSNLDGIQGRALADIVGNNPHVQTARMRNVFTQPADENRILARGMGYRRRITTRLPIVHHHDTRRGLEQGADAIDADLAAGLDVHRFGMTVVDGDAHGRRIHLDGVVAEDLARFPDQLHLFLGVTVGLEVVDVRDQVEGDLHREALRVRGAAGNEVGALLLEFIHGRAAAARHRLVGRHVDALDADLPMDRRERHQHLHGRAIGVGDDAARRIGNRVRIYFAHHQRHVVVVVEGRRVVHDDCAGRGKFRRVLRGRRTTCRKQRDVHAGRIESREVLHHDLLVAELDGLPRRSRARERDQFFHRELALIEDGQHDLANGAGGAHDCNGDWSAHGSSVRVGMRGNTSPTSAFWARWRKAWSISTRAIIASQMGVARRPTQGSWRPVVTTSTSAPDTSTVRPGRRRLDVGLKATEQVTGWPVEMPPRMPPAWLLRNPSRRISSRCSLPFCSTLPKPAPISTPFTALMLIIAAASSASSLPYTGSPQPGGTLVATTSTRAPTESPDLRKASMKASISPTWLASGQKKGLASMADASKLRGTMSAICETWPRMAMPWRSASHLRAITAAATRMVVSRAELRPPPRGSRMPYFCQ